MTLSSVVGRRSAGKAGWREVPALGLGLRVLFIISADRLLANDRRPTTDGRFIPCAKGTNFSLSIIAAMKL